MTHGRRRGGVGVGLLVMHTAAKPVGLESSVRIGSVAGVIMRTATKQHRLEGLTSAQRVERGLGVRPWGQHR